MQENEEVVLTKDDIDNVETFFNHFGMPIPEYLKKMIKVFRDKDNPTLEDQKEFKAAISHATLTSEHDIMKNDVWTGVLVNCDEAYYNAQFDKELNEVLSEEGEKK